MTCPGAIPNQSDAAVNTLNMANIESLAGQSRYCHVVAWGMFLGFTPATVRREVALAEAENAPLDAIQKLDGRWVTLDEIANGTNRSRVEELARGGATRQR